MFVNIAGTSHRALSRSHFSEEEADVCVSLARRLLSVGVSSTGICVITFYKEQNRRLAPLLRDLGISLATVDSIQGREMDVVIVLTTKTAFATEAGEFLNDHHRMTVALTRCRHGQFVLGHVDSLRTLPGWNAVLRWATQHLCFVQASDLPSFFPPSQVSG
ncbi:hypothetical protein Q1695_011970 [Nippostrongylus brasiliensis]|nr:hypothetical protein Q1695_011970 [Nippostrongylus brasiliensis]